MKVVIRIRGKVKLNRDLENTLDRLRLRKKYSCIVSLEKKEFQGMLKKVVNLVAYGDIDDKTLKELIDKRGLKIDKGKPRDIEKAVDALKDGKKLENFNIKPFFRLHPPRKGIDTKKAFPKGVLGNHGKKINELIMKML